MKMTISRLKAPAGTNPPPLKSQKDQHIVIRQCKQPKMERGEGLEVRVSRGGMMARVLGEKSEGRGAGLRSGQALDVSMQGW